MSEMQAVWFNLDSLIDPNITGGRVEYYGAPDEHKGHLALEDNGWKNQVMMYALKLKDPRQAGRVRDALNDTFPGVDFSLTSEFSESLNDFKTITSLVQQISLLAVFIGGLGMLNTLLIPLARRRPMYSPQSMLPKPGME